MKIKLKPGGKLILTLFFLAVFYLLLSVTGLLGIFSSEEKQIESGKQEPVKTRIPDRELKIGFIKGVLPQNLLFANGSYETKENSIFHKYGLNIKLIEHKDINELLSAMEVTGDNGGIDAAYLGAPLITAKRAVLDSMKAKCFFLCDQSTEENHFLTDAKLKKAAELNGGKVSVTDSSYSLSILAALLQKLKISSMTPVFTTDAPESFKKLVSGKSQAAIIKEKAFIEILKQDNRVKTLLVEKTKQNNYLLASSSTIEEYYPYFKSLVKGLSEAADLLILQKSYNTNTEFFNLNANNLHFNTFLNGISQFTGKMESEIRAISLFIGGLNNFDFRTLAYSKLITDLIETSSKPTVSEIQPSQIQSPNETLSQSKEAPKNSETKRADTKIYSHARSNDAEINNTCVKLKNIHRDKAELSNYYMVNFDPDCTLLDTVAQNKLSQIADVIKSKNTDQVVLIGHADTTGEEAYNVILSRKRAEAVMDYLSENFGINKNIFKLYGKGSAEPLGNNSDKKWRRLNRRVNITIKSK